MPTQYEIVITAVGAGGAAPADGFIDNKTIEQYMASGSLPTTLAQTTAKERANLRFDFLREQLQREANVYILEAVATGANATTAGTDFTLTVEVERGDSVLYTLDEGNGNAVLTEIDAITHWVARALVEERTTYGDTYDPTTASTAGNATLAARRGIRLEQIVVGALAANLTAAKALVTVTKL